MGAQHLRANAGYQWKQRQIFYAARTSSSPSIAPPHHSPRLASCRALARHRRRPRSARSFGPVPTVVTLTEMTFLFATGIENSYPTIANGKRIDQMDKCGHYARWEDDF